MLIAHLAESVELDFPLGSSVQDVRDTLRHVLTIPVGAVASVNGHDVGGDHVVGATDVVEFWTEWGHKGVGDHVWDAEEYCRVFNLTERELRDQIQRGLRVMELTNGTMRITETAVDEFIRGMNGGVGSEVITTIARSLERIANHIRPPARINRGGPTGTGYRGPRAPASADSRMPSRSSRTCCGMAAIAFDPPIS
jgi:hypothetical protein